MVTELGMNIKSGTLAQERKGRKREDEEFGLREELVTIRWTTRTVESY